MKAASVCKTLEPMSRVALLVNSVGNRRHTISWRSLLTRLNSRGPYNEPSRAKEARRLQSLRVNQDFTREKAISGDLNHSSVFTGKTSRQLPIAMCLCEPKTTCGQLVGGTVHASGATKVKPNSCFALHSEGRYASMRPGLGAIHTASSFFWSRRLGKRAACSIPQRSTKSGLQRQKQSVLKVSRILLVAKDLWDKVKPNSGNSGVQRGHHLGTLLRADGGLGQLSLLTSLRGVSQGINPGAQHLAYVIILHALG